MNSILLEHFDGLLAASEDVEQLNRAILDLAVHGKLTYQEADDEPAKELLKRLYFEKNDSSLTIKEEEKPFDLPQGWEWVKLKDLGQTQTGTTPPTSNPDFFGKDYAFIKPADISDNAVDYSNEGLSKLGIEKGRLIKANSILMVCIGGSIGKVGYVDRDCSCNQQINVLTPSDQLVHKVIYYFLKSPYFQNEVLSRAPKTTLPILSKGKWEMILIPVPPFAEQQRIVARVEELFAQTRALAKELNHSQSELEGLNQSALSHLLASATPEEFNQHWEFIAEHFDLLFQTPEHVAPLRQSILELAVRGKLTHKLPTAIFSDDLPGFPADWKVETLENISRDADYGTSQKCDYDASETPVLRIPNIIGGRINLGDVKHATKPEELSKDKSLAPNDFLIVRTNGSKDLVGRGSVVTREFENGTYFASYLIRYRLADHGLWVNTIWTTHLIREQIEKIAKTSAGQYNVNINNLNRIRIPIPPLAEQERIVKRVEQLLSLCDALEARLQSAEDERGRLVRAVMAGVGSFF